jgi:hypothetical protein
MPTFSSTRQLARSSLRLSLVSKSAKALAQGKAEVLKSGGRRPKRAEMLTSEGEA